MPGRSREVRAPSRKELKATAVLALRISEASTKTHTGPPKRGSSSDDFADAWTGVVPVLTSYGMSPSVGAVRQRVDNRHRERNE